MDHNQNPLLTLQDIPQKCLYPITARNLLPSSLEKNQLPEKQSNEWSYKDCVNKFDFIFNCASRNQDLQKMIIEFINSVKKIFGEQFGINSDMSTWKMRRNIEHGGAKKTNGTYQCKQCK